MPPTGPRLDIRTAGKSDHDQIWRIFEEVLTAGDTYTWPPDTTRDQALALWFPPNGFTFVAEIGDDVIATYLLRPNQPGQGRHVANCAYMVARRASGHGVGEALCRHSLDEAKRRGFEAMQFNFVVSTNEKALHLWRKCGFQVIGTIPRGFRHPSKGLVDAYVMHRFL
jgi:ribosomal protein S18 acetylase RimI-like enzyme